MATEISQSEFIESVFNLKGREEKKDFLKTLSEKAKLLLENVPEISMQFSKVNEVIINVMYKCDQHNEFKSFKEWKAAGYTVKKGSKAFIVWSTPRKASKVQDNPDKKDEYRFFGIAHLFSNDQVEKINS